MDYVLILQKNQSEKRGDESIVAAADKSNVKYVVLKWLN